MKIQCGFSIWKLKIFFTNILLILAIYVNLGCCNVSNGEFGQKIPFDFKNVPSNTSLNAEDCKNETWPNFRCSNQKSCFTMQQTCDGHDDCSDSTDECDSMCAQTFQCEQSKQCIAVNRFCNGIIDCADGSDEISPNENNKEFVCGNAWNTILSSPENNLHWKDARIATNAFARELRVKKNSSDQWQLKCVLPPKLVCDGINHCGDHSDECSPIANCSTASKFYCKNRRCIAKQNVCDGRDDCGDSSDECHADCKKDFRCKDGTCIAFNQFCDGIAQCQDGSDEIYDALYDNSSFFSAVQCSNINNFSPQQCLLPSRFICDGVEHCFGREDECAESCHFSFRCANGRCVVNTKLCDRFDDCGDMSDECVDECNHGYFHCANGTCLSVDRFCDGVRDCFDGEDEAQSVDDEETSCYGISLSVNERLAKKCLLPTRYVCDDIDHCRDREDECGRNCSNSFFCDHGMTCVSRLNLCNGIPDCKDLSDEPTIKGSLSTQRGFKCEVLRNEPKECILPQKFIDDWIPDCADSRDEFLPSSLIPFGKTGRFSLCFQNQTTIISERQICDGVFDCIDLSDECFCESNVVQYLCQQICFDSACDYPGMIPCLLLDDESILNGKFQNKNNYVKDQNAEWVSITHFCDGVYDCKNKADEMYCNLNVDTQRSVSASFSNTSTTTSVDANNRTVSCFRFQANNIWTPEVARPCDGKPECFFLEDECDMNCVPTPLFCELRAFSGSFQCPSGSIIPGKKVCDGKLDCSYDHDERYCLNRFYCQSGQVIKSVDIFKVCDYKTDCEDASDERNCSKTHFYCANGNPIFVRRQNVMDGRADCSDRSDECPQNFFTDAVFSSQRHLIKEPFLKGMVWVMSFFAIAGNFNVIAHGILLFQSSCRKKFSRLAFMYHVIIFNLAVSDLLMGIFLLDLGIRDVIWSGSYCFQDRAWRSGSECRILGVLSTLSVEVSLTSLALLATYRAYCVLNPMPSRSLKIRTLILCVAFTWVVGFCIAFLPLLETTQDYFVTQLWLKNSPYFLQDVIEKDKLQQFCQTYLVYDNSWLQNFTNSFNACSKWENLIEIVLRVHSIEKVDGVFGYYGKHATCLPKMFLTSKEASWKFSIVVTLFNFLLCIYIVGLYLRICRRKPRTLSSLSSQQTKAIQTRVALLIGSDCACWVPVCLVAFLRFSGQPISDGMYAFTAIILLPINSAVNPLFHSSTWKHIRSVVENMKRRSFQRKKSERYSCQKAQTQETTTHSNALLRVSVATEHSGNSSLLNPAVLETRV